MPRTCVQKGGNFTVFDEIFSDDFIDHKPQRGITADKQGVRRLHGIAHW